MKKQKGFFIVLEGGEGSGKTTLLEKVSSFYGDKVVVTREPGGSPFAEEIRNLILHSPNAKQANAIAMFCLFCAARADHLKNTIVPALNAGKIVICDRFDASTYAYQTVAQGAKELKPLFWIMRDYLLAKGKYKPNIYIYLDVNPEIGLIRKETNKNEKKNHFDERDLKFEEYLRHGFKEFFEGVSHGIIDASSSKDEVWKAFKAILEKVIDKK